jgi:ribose transport system substrate-binding protein
MDRQLRSPAGARSGFMSVGAALVVVVLAFALAACGSGDSTSAASRQTSTGSGGSGDSSTTAARAAIAPLLSKPTAFPVTEPLKKRPTGATIAYMDSGSPISALQYQLLLPAAKTMGVKIAHIKAGPDAKTVATGFVAAVGMRPDAVIVSAQDIDLWKNQLKQLQDLKVPIVTTGVTGTDKYGIKATAAGDASNQLAGDLLGDYTVAKMDPSDVVVYQVPEVSFSKQIADKIVAQIRSRCPQCSVRTANVALATLGNTAPNTIVSDLQAHPKTKTAVFVLSEMASGLPAAMRSAGIKVQTLGYAPGPQQFQDLKDGKLTALLAYDLPVNMWTLLDMAARLIEGQELSGPSAQGKGVIQFLTQKDVTFDPSKGWTGYPDFPARFAKLWGVKG